MNSTDTMNAWAAHARAWLGWRITGVGEAVVRVGYRLADAAEAAQRGDEDAPFVDELVRVANYVGATPSELVQLHEANHRAATR